MRFCLGPTLMSYEIHVMCDYPQTGQSFERGKYHELDWFCNRGDPYDPDRHADIPINRAGTFHFYYYAADVNDELVKVTLCAIFRTVYFLVHFVDLDILWSNLILDILWMGYAV